MLNKVILIGRLTRDPDLRYTPSGVPVATFTLAVDRPRQNQQGERETDFIDVVVWRKLAETCSNYLGKGRQVLVEGSLQIRSYETAEGQRRKVAEVIASNVQFLDRPKGQAAQAGHLGAAAGPEPGVEAGTGAGGPGEPGGAGGSGGGRGFDRGGPGGDEDFLPDGGSDDLPT